MEEKMGQGRAIISSTPVCEATGISKVFEQCLLCTAVQNMKKIALVVDRDDLLRLLEQLRPFLTPYKLCKWLARKLDSLKTAFMQIEMKHIVTTEIENPA